jgi:hypothetical protein
METHMRKLTVGIVALALGACATVKPAKPIETAPIAAINVSVCGGSAALFVVVDPHHVVRFDQKQTSVLTAGDERTSPPTDFKKALELANQSPITTNVTLPCPNTDKSI